ncbi:MAG TPA: crossover junction endodeoxyribonuclease RuvC [Clostridiales bacterium]|nr:crossover junction endodeoxyribonuclease RuvC [Clostridiales bacterium]
MRIIGIDPGFAITGYGVIEHERGGFTMLDCGVVSTHAGLPMTDRLLTLSRRLEEIVNRWQPQQGAVEELFFSKNEKTALNVGHGRGVALLCLARAGLQVYEYTPLQVKQAVTGYGRAEKSQIQYMVRILLNLPEPPRPDDAADALAVAICHANAGTLARGGIV